ncbi:Cell death abnormality protein 3 [Trichostrongylus colubriformis]|uniref:Cell death abnormality protein 3 n=1 Tax=Trichostrongylus colubriformis TaxID=6319 RepID=A0AAN8GE38_TRICO
MMRNERRKLLDRSLLVLSREMEVDDVLHYLQGKEVFTDAVVEKVQAAGGPSAQRAAIVRAVKTRGDRAFEAFFRALLHARQPHLADLLRPLVDEAVLQTLENENESHYAGDTTIASRVKLNRMDMPPMEPTGLLEDLRVDMIDSNQSPVMEMFLKNRDSIYPNFSVPKGLCLIFNNENFASMPRRQGTEIDCANLKNLFTQLGYSVKIEHDLSCKEMLSRVRSFASDPQHRFASSAIVVVLTHGERDQLLGVSGDDDVLSVYPFLEALNARNAPLLSGKPKLVFIQACRGDRRDTGVKFMDESDGFQQANDGPFGLFNCMRPGAVVETNPIRPRESDFLIAYATPPTYVSWRNSLRGSWFVQAICEVFAKHARNADILQLLTKVNQRVAECFQTSCSSSYKQMPEFHSRLIKQFYFFPGITRSSSV